VEQRLSAKKEAAKSLGVSLRTLETLIALGELRSIRVGRRRLIPIAELDRFTRRDHKTRIVTESEGSHAI
jgi:excisionase family DNA binding protein